MNEYLRVICPGCGWAGSLSECKDNASCPKCGYENGAEPFRLLTLKELLADNGGVYNDVCMGRFLSRVIAEME